MTLRSQHLRRLTSAFLAGLTFTVVVVVSVACSKADELLPSEVSIDEATVTLAGKTFTARVARVSPRVFESQPVLLGRPFSDLDLELDARPVVVLSHALWVEFGEDPSLIGSTLTAPTDLSRIILGVTDEEFGALEDVDLFVPSTPARSP